MALTTAVGSGGYQEVFVDLFISAVRRAAVEQRSSLANLFADAPHLKKRFDHITNTKKPIWNRTITENVFNSFDKQIFCGALSEEERQHLREMFDHCYRPEIRTERKSPLRPRYKNGRKAVVEYIDKFVVERGCTLSGLVKDPAQLITLLEVSVQSLTEKDLWGEAAVLLDASLQFLLLDDSISKMRSNARVGAIGMVAHLAVMVFSVIHDVHKLQRTVKLLSDVFVETKDRQVQFEGLLANSLLLKCVSETLLFTAHEVSGMETVLGNIAQWAADKSVQMTGQAVDLGGRPDEGLASYHKLPNARAAALLRFACSQRAQETSSYRLLNTENRTEVAGLTTLIDTFGSFAGMSTEQEKRSNFLSVRFALALAHMHCNSKSDDDVSTSIVMLDYARKCLLGAKVCSHVIWIEWYQTFAHMAPLTGLRASEVQSLVHTADLLISLGSASPLPYLENKRGEAVRAELQTPIERKGVGEDVLGPLESLVEFLALKPPPLDRRHG